MSERDVEVTWPAGAERPVASETARTDEEINREEAGQDAEEEQGKRYRRKGDALLDFPPPSVPAKCMACSLARLACAKAMMDVPQSATESEQCKASVERANTHSRLMRAMSPL